MLELPHTLVGAAIAKKIPNPLFSLPMAFFSHFLVDLIPHWNPSLYTETKKFGKPTKASVRIIYLDVAASLIAGFLIARQVLPNLLHFTVILMACFLSVLPDVIEAPYFFFNFRPKILRKIIVWQHNHQGRAGPFWGLISQVILSVLLFIFFLN